MPKFEHDFTFESFVVTPYNELAFSAAKAIAEHPGTRFNPFFYHGEFLSGKTHLLHATGNALIERRPHIRILRVSGARLKHDISYALKNRKLSGIKYALEHNRGRLANFNRLYRDCDVLMIDGFDELAECDLEQNVFIRLCTAMVTDRKQVMLAARLPYERFPVIAEYFRSSYTTGLVCEIFAPEELAANKAYFLGIE